MEKIKVTLKQGPVLEGPQLVAALKRLVEIGGEVEREESANGCEKLSEARAAGRHRDQAR